MEPGRNTDGMDDPRSLWPSDPRASMRRVALTAVDEYVSRTEDDELTDEVAERGAERFADLLGRLGA